MMVGRRQGRFVATRHAREIMTWARDVLEFLPEHGEDDVYRFAWAVRRHLRVRDQRELHTMEVLAMLLGAAAVGLITLRLADDADPPQPIEQKEPP